MDAIEHEALFWYNSIIPDDHAKNEGTIQAFLSAACGERGKARPGDTVFTGRFLASRMLVCRGGSGVERGGGLYGILSGGQVCPPCLCTSCPFSCGLSYKTYPC